jgi:predicted nucleotide-binding protein
VLNDDGQWKWRRKRIFRPATKSIQKSGYFKQSDFPRVILQEAQRIAAGLAENFGNDGSASPPDVALAIGISPTSSGWTFLTGASIAYGLTGGGYNADQIKLTPLGKKLVEPEEEGADVVARREAILKPRILREFFEKYRRAKFPSDVIAINVLKSLSIPADRVREALDILKANGKYAGIIRDTPTGPFVSLDSPGVPTPTATQVVTDQSVDEEDADEDLPLPASSGIPAPIPAKSNASDDPKANRVFITHGKKKGIVEQLKDLLEYGKFDPVVSVERESTAIPVPEKVFEDMRSCSAGVIHVASEGKWIDTLGNEQPRINDNVLIEIGAAMALYGKKVILLVERGLTLPSNLQGLYRCDFEGDKLDYESTMKLLKTFNQFR